MSRKAVDRLKALAATPADEPEAWRPALFTEECARIENANGATDPAPR